uniref:Fibronectin type-III domain-containing protein n=1 Tax=Hippocampus comes TaxID=109280 RepID=A0A3Q3DKS3_HIPCM
TETGVNLDCTNDYEYRMSCHFDAPNCTEYNVTLRSLDGETHCLPVQCASEKCCCSIRMLLILDENHTAFVRRRGEYVESKNISVKYIKPQTPSIVSVNETNGNFQVIWRTNINKHHIREIISTLLTYRKKGETEEVRKTPQVETQLCFLCFTSEILGAHLEPNTTYVVTAQNLLPWESQPSDRSEEYEFTTRKSRHIISHKSRTMPITHIIKKEQVLKPMPPIISSIYVETLTPGDLKPWSKGSLIDSSTESLLQSSGISSGPSSLSYACTEAADIIAGVQGAVSKALMNIVPASASTNHLLKESSKPNGVLSTRPSPCNSEQHSGCENAVTYSFIRPVHVIPETLKSHAQSQLPFECGYQSTGSGSTCDDKRGSACEENSFPTLVSSYTLTPASRQQANRDSGKFSIGENSDASLSCSNTSLSGDVESRMETGHEGCQEMFISGACGKGEDATKEGKALLCIPASLQGHFPVDDNYQVHRCLKELRDRPFEDETHLKNQDLSKALENYSKDATKSDTGFHITVVQASVNNQSRFSL